MGKFILAEIVILALGLVVSAAAEAGSAAATTIVAVVFGIAAATPVALAVGLIAVKRRPRQVHHYYDQRQVHIYGAQAQPPFVEPPALGDGERALTRSNR
jgi:hypothetical protein